MNTQTTRFFRFAPVLAAAMIVAAGTLLAGPINPPAGPVASTLKTLAEVEPRIVINATNTPGTVTALFTITQPGSYFLAGNITGVSGKNGIEIAASGVTLDLNGFDLVGAAGGSLDGVNVSVPGTSNVAVVNGSVRNWFADGVDVSNATTTRLADLRVSSNRNTGIRVGGNAVVTNCSVRLSNGDNFNIGTAATVTNCSAQSSTGGSGINAGDGCTITGCSVASNAVNGITASIGCTISNCTAQTNTGNGIATSNGCTITDCSAMLNTLDGIRVVGTCTVRGNTCDFNGSGGSGAGIHATFTRNRIEGNNCTGADRGIAVDLSGNIIIRNTCSNNTNNWDVAANNIILVVNALVAPAVNGVSGGTAPGSTDPNANFSY